VDEALHDERSLGGRIGKDESFLYKLVNEPGKLTEFSRQFNSAV
jgi:hypothetical protein